MGTTPLRHDARDQRHRDFDPGRLRIARPREPVFSPQSMNTRAALDSAGTVSIRGVTRFYGSVRGVENLNLEIRAGEFFTLLGASGSGKTTMLRLIGGFEQATAGRMFIGGRDETDLRACRRNVHTVFQDYALFPHLTVSENVAFALDLKSGAKSEIHAKVESALELVDLAGFGARLPAQLSGGQQQRVALARALVD